MRQNAMCCAVGLILLGGLSCVTRPAGTIRIASGQITPSEQQNENNAVKRRVMHAYLTGSSYTASKQVWTLEGDPVTYQIVLNDGDVTVVHDFSHDPLGPPGVYGYQIQRLHLGYRNSLGTFTEVGESDPTSTEELLIRYKLPGRGEFFF